MCLAIPSKVINVDEMMATIDVKGARTSVSLMLMPEEVQEGDYVLVHAGFAIQKVDEQAAHEALRLIDEIVEQLEAEGMDHEEDDF